MVSWDFVVLALAAASGAVTAAAQLLTSTRAAKRQRDDVERLKKEAQDRAIDSSDIEVLGRYLYDEIGDVRVSDVVADSAVRSRTLDAISRLTLYVGDESAAATRIPVPHAAEAEALDSDELAKSREQILAGEIWNGLARMRRHLEITLREADPRLQQPRITGAGQLIAAAEQRGVLPPEVVPQLRYAVSVANRAIHGEPAEMRVALEAVDAADYGLRHAQLVSRSDQKHG